ncbi:MAG: hypothetical protein ACOX6T_27465, partial [Myxococcales bacterium]
RSSGDVKTNADGSFSVPVEPGFYRVLVKPGAERRLPWASRTIQAIDPDASASAVEVIAVSEAREVYGTVNAPTGSGTLAGVANAKIVVYRPPATSSLLSPPPPPAVVYEALTDSRGQFKVLVPKAEAE